MENQNRIIIEIQQSGGVRTQSGTSKRTGNHYSIRKQEGWFHNGKEPYPTKIEVNLEENQPPYPPGLYEVDLAKSVIVDRYNSLSFGRLHLLQAKPKAADKAA